jgi:poly-gamma-glutamate system protein
MKKIYWRPHRVSNAALFLIASLSLAGFIAVEFLKVKTKQRFYPEKMVASRLARNAMEVIKQERLKRGVAIDLEVDPTQSGLIGVSMSSVTSDTGYIQAKQCSINPNWAAVIVHLLKLAGVKEGDLVAVGPSGSFPVINIGAYAAIQTLKAKPIIVSSAAASQFGANLPDLLWIDMERILVERHVFNFRSVAASRGGIDDRGFGMSKEARQMLDDAIIRNGLQLIDVKTTTEGTDRRMQIYSEQAGGAPIKAYINIGGGTASVGTTVAKKLFKPGLNRTAPRGAVAIDSVLARFANEGIPVIHMVYVAELAQRYGLPLQPTEMPPIGQGKVFFKQEYNTPLAVGVLVLILISMFAFIRLDIGFRILRTVQRSDKKGAHPEQMV